MKTLVELIKKINKKPGMYIGSPSISKLFMFLQGYRYACYEQGVTFLEQEDVLFSGFQKWIEEKYKIESSHSWDAIILFYTGNEEEAFRNFNVLFNEYLEKINFLTRETEII